MSRLCAGLIGLAALFLVSSAVHAATLMPLLLTPGQVAQTISPRTFGGVRWIRATVRIKPSAGQAGAAAVFSVKRGAVNFNLIQSVVRFKHPQPAMRVYNVWHDTAVTSLHVARSRMFAIHGLGRAATCYQVGAKYYDIRFVDRSLIEELRFTSKGPKLSRKSMIQLARRAYAVERHRH